MTTRSRRAYTLLELLLVLAVLVIIAAIGYPMLDGMSAPYKVQGAVDATKAAWAQAHVHAMDEGRPYRFAVVPGRGNFRIGPDDDAYWSGGDPPDLNSDNPAYVFEDTLPTDVRFIFNGNGAGKTDESFEVGKVGSGQWVPVVVFLPDGTASDDVQITFDCAAARSMTIQLRAITGTSTVLPQDHNSGDNSP